MNNCMFIGRLVDNPVLDAVKDTSICKFSLAVSRKYKSKDKMVEEVNFLDMVAWDKGAESIAQWFKKGDPIIIYSSARQERWTDNDGKNRSKIVFRVEKFDFPPQNKGKGKQESESTPDLPDDPSVNASSEDIPF